MGAQDPHVTLEERTVWEREMTEAGVDWHLHVYGRAQHGFTERATKRPGCEYDETAATAARSSALAFLDMSFALAQGTAPHQG